MSNTAWPFPPEYEIDLSSMDYKIQIENDPMSTYTYSTTPTGNVTIGNITTTASTNWTTGASNTAFGYSAGNWATTAPSNVLDVHGDNADVVINGKSLSKFMETMESRLAILQPDLEKLEHFAALKKAYDHYKALEALCELPKNEDDN